ncbi:LemA family protein [Acidobacteria bacterium AB60]|nr:LemA family protein [Acidobacteria bacterium AB60]
MRRGSMVLLVVIAVIVVACLFVYGSFKSAQNQLVQKKEAVRSAWSQVDVDLQRRADLIPNLVETVKGFTKEENSVFGEIANARAGLLNASTPQDKIAANGRLDGAFGRLLALTENYPQLRSSDQFMRLQDELAGTENRISVSRRRYNQTLQDYNTFVQQFPNSIWANILGFHENDAYFQASESSRTAPKVSF